MQNHMLNKLYFQAARWKANTWFEQMFSQFAWFYSLKKYVRSFLNSSKPNLFRNFANAPRRLFGVGWFTRKEIS